MTTCLLIRHGQHTMGTDAIMGRRVGVHLSEEGRLEAERLAGSLATVRLARLYSSPLERTLETAEILGKRLNLEVSITEEIQELDFGEWAGRSFEELKPDEAWNRFNRYRSGTQAPSGEWMLEAQGRVVKFLFALQERHAGGSVALVSHADVIKSAIAYFLGTPLDLFHRIEISPASVSAIQLADWGPRILCVNSFGGLPV
jgi:probable phosphoglycerate mutase